MLTLMIHAGFEGSYHCRKNYLTRVTLTRFMYFFCNVAAFISCMNNQSKHFNVLMKKGVKIVR